MYGVDLGLLLRDADNVPLSTIVHRQGSKMRFLTSYLQAWDMFIVMFIEFLFILQQYNSLICMFTMGIWINFGSIFYVVNVLR
jgi:hypothetical protein